MPPQLLVSVRSREEAEIAAKAGVPIIDFKEPNAGSLGMLNVGEIQSCVSAIRSIAPMLKCSAAMGEVTDWLDTACDEVAEFPSLNFLKLGLSKLGDDREWKKKWLVVRNRIENVFKIHSTVPPGWVAVAYVDSDLARSPSVSKVIRAAGETDCRGVLFDTFEKSDKRFSDWVNEDQLLEDLEHIHESGMFCAVAGRLKREDVEKLAKHPVDIIAVRSAACIDGERTGIISKGRIQELNSLLNLGSDQSVNNSTSQPLHQL